MPVIKDHKYLRKDEAEKLANELKAEQTTNNVENELDIDFPEAEEKEEPKEKIYWFEFDLSGQKPLVKKECEILWQDDKMLRVNMPSDNNSDELDYVVPAPVKELDKVRVLGGISLTDRSGFCGLMTKDPDEGHAKAKFLEAIKAQVERSIKDNESKMKWLENNIQKLKDRLKEIGA